MGSLVAMDIGGPGAGVYGVSNEGDGVYGYSGEGGIAMLDADGKAEIELLLLSSGVCRSVTYTRTSNHLHTLPMS
jgi:hypothetical protein